MSSHDSVCPTWPSIPPAACDYRLLPQVRPDFQRELVTDAHREQTKDGPATSTCHVNVRPPPMFINACHLTPPLPTCNMPPRQPRPHGNAPPPRLRPVHPTLPSFDHSAGTCPNGAPPQPRSTHRTGVQLNHACASSTNSKSTLNTTYTRARSLFLVS
jgi:hypothetical protein